MAYPKHQPDQTERIVTSDGLRMSPDVHPTAVRLRHEREARGWSRRDLLDQMIAAGYLPLTSDQNMIRTIARWETEGVHPNRPHQQVLARVYGTAVLTLFGPAAADPVWPPVDPAETLARIHRSDLDPGTLDDLAITVDRLCTAYSAGDPTELIGDAALWLAEIDRALTGRATARQTRGLHDAAAWLALLAGCLYNDLGDRARAEGMRATGGLLARDAGDRRAVAWSHEMRVWFALCDGELHAAIVAADAGIAAAPASDVAVQLHGQQAEAWARLGDRHQAAAALDQARQVLDGLAWPANPGNHFTVDPPKFRKARMRLAVLLGDVDTATIEADAVIREGLRPDGSHRQPMRVADAHGSLAVVAARAGDVEGAVRHAHTALDVPRVSRPSLQLVIGEALAVLPAGDAAVAELAARARAV